MPRPARILTSLLLATTALPAGAGSAPGQIVWFGTHGNGIFAARLAPDGHLTPLGLAAEIERPTWLVKSPNQPLLYATSETGNDGKSEAGVYSLSIDGATGKLTTLNKVGSGGGGATYLALDPRSHTLFVANYGSGSVAALPVKADGSLGPAAAVVQESGSGPSPRQKSAHAHCLALDPSGHFLLVADLGADRIFVYRFTPATRQLAPAATPAIVAPAGSGPRHLAFAPDGHTVYIDSELTGEISAYHWDRTAGRLSLTQTLSAFPSDDSGPRNASELALSRDGRFLYLSTRSNDSLIVYAVDRASGKLREVQRLASGGKSPWSFALSPDGRWLLVANEASSQISEFRIDRLSGRLSVTNQALAVPHPVSVAFS